MVKAGMFLEDVAQEAKGLESGCGRVTVVSPMGTPYVAYLRDLVMEMMKAVLAALEWSR